MTGPASPPGARAASPVGPAELLESALDALDDAVVVVDRDLVVVHGAARLARELGAVPVAPTGDAVRAAGGEVVHEDGSSWAPRERPLVRAVREGVTTTREVLGLALHGHTRWLHISARPLPSPDGAPPYPAVATYRDVTDMVVSRRELEESEAHFRLLAENSTDVIRRFTTDGVCRYASPAIVDVLGWTPGQVEGTSGLHGVHPDDVATVAQQRGEILRTRQPQVMRYRARTADARWVWVETLCRALVGADGRVHEFQTSTRDISARVEAERRLARLALTDALSGLANRAALVQHLEDRLAEGRPLALLFLDLDRFKVINDSLGHGAGDEVLRVVAGRLTGTCRDGDVVARLGGDEFVVVADGLDETAAVHLAERVQLALAAPVALAGQDVTVSASVGIVVTDPDRVVDADALLRDADASMYRAKGRGRAQSVVWTAAVEEPAGGRSGLERGLRAVLGGADQGGPAGALEVHYQPQVRLGTGEVLGFEALVRWRHPERGLLLPAAFLAVAEDTGLVVELGEQVLAAAVRQLATWRGLPGRAGLRLSVNLCAQELRRGGGPGAALRLLAQAGLPVQALTVEVREDVLLDAEGSVARSLVQYADSGIALALDDLGTGSCSLLHLRSLPVTELKVDRAFVAGVGGGGRGTSRVDEAVVRAVRSLCEDLGIACVAEGIETEDQRRWLVRQGVALGQGFLLSRPLTAEAATALLVHDVPATRGLPSASGRQRPSGG